MCSRDEVAPKDKASQDPEPEVPEKKPMAETQEIP